MKQAIPKVVLIGDIMVHDQVRTSFDAVKLIELSESVHMHGVIAPIALNDKGGKLHLVCGGRRYLAQNNVINGFTNLKGEKVPGDKTRNQIAANVYTNLTDDEILDMQIIENLQRDNPHPMMEAAAYQRMMNERKFTVPEIAKRVGQSDKYVALRLKLNNLIPDLQKAFYEERMSMSTALLLSKFGPDSQKDLTKNVGKNQNIYVDNYAVNQHERNLSKAPFDTKDANIIKAVGACTMCPHNTSGNVLFPDENGKSLCMNGKCYDQKRKISFDQKFEEAKADPQSVFITSSYYTSNLDDKMRKMCGKIYTRDDYKEVVKPAQKDIDAGKVKKGFFVHGDAKGHSIFCTIINRKEVSASSSGPAKGSAGAFKEKVSTGKVKPEDIDAEIKRINDAEKRKKEIDMEHAWPEIHKLLKGNKKFMFNLLPLSIAEKVATVLVLDSKISYSFNDQQKIFESEGWKGRTGNSEFTDWLTKNPKKLDGIIAGLSRIFFYSNIGDSFRTNDADITALSAVIDGYNAPEKKKVMDKVDADRKKRADRIESTINGLKEKKKSLDKPKGLSALLPDQKKKAKKKK